MTVLECPFCFEPLKVEAPDKVHMAFSSAKPINNSYYGNVVKKNVKCPSCKRTVTIFWYAPLEYFSRV